MKDTKYDYRRLGKHIFRIRFDKFSDATFGLMVRYEIEDPADIPRNLWERLKQFFTVSRYHFGYWIPSRSGDTLEERVAKAMALVVEDWDTQSNAEKEWEAL